MNRPRLFVAVCESCGEQVVLKGRLRVNYGINTSAGERPREKHDAGSVKKEIAAHVIGRNKRILIATYNEQRLR